MAVVDGQAVLGKYCCVCVCMKENIINEGRLYLGKKILEIRMDQIIAAPS